jgi:cytochrome c-type biogenesis protein CcmE
MRPGAHPRRAQTLGLCVILTVGAVLAVTLVYRSFHAGHDELTASQLLARAQPRRTYILTGTVLHGSITHHGGALVFRVCDPRLPMSVPIHYTGAIPNPFAAGRTVHVEVHKTEVGRFVGQPNSLMTAEGAAGRGRLCIPDLRSALVPAS